MDSWLARAKAFAEDAAKKSQDMALQGAIMSEQLAKEAAKKSRELAEEAARSADIGMKALVKEFSTTTIASPEKSQLAFTPNELLEYGITDDLREFVNGITIKTFKDFPLSEADSASPEAASSLSSASSSNVAADLSPWRERHALLVLQAVSEMSDFRYVLCPRRMTERRFWRIYFELVHTHIAPYEQRAKEKAEADEKLREEQKSGAKMEPQGESLFGALLTRTKNGLVSFSQKQQVAVAEAESARKDGGPAVSGPSGASPVEAAADAEWTKKKGEEHDLDEYLMGALEPGGTAADDDGEEGDFDPDDFDKLVNNEEDSEASEGGGVDKAAEKQKGITRGSPRSSADAMSDGELVEPPSPELEPQGQQQGGTAGH